MQGPYNITFNDTCHNSQSSDDRHQRNFTNQMTSFTRVNWSGPANLWRFVVCICNVFNILSL